MEVPKQCRRRRGGQGSTPAPGVPGVTIPRGRPAPGGMSARDRGSRGTPKKRLPPALAGRGGQPSTSHQAISAANWHLDLGGGGLSGTRRGPLLTPAGASPGPIRQIIRGAAAIRGGWGRGHFGPGSHGRQLAPANWHQRGDPRGGGEVPPSRGLAPLSPGIPPPGSPRAGAGGSPRRESDQVPRPPTGTNGQAPTGTSPGAARRPSPRALHPCPGPSTPWRVAAA